MVCMAPSTTNKVVEGLINGFDGDVITWSNQILKVNKLCIEVLNTLLNCRKPDSLP